MISSGKIGFLLLGFVIGFIACGKRSVPARSARILYDGVPHSSAEITKTPVENMSADSVSTETVSVTESKPGIKRAPAKFPKTIYVNDAVATKSVDGRLYYDVEGHRYWKNFKDGKYYLFDKSMYDNPDFRPPGKNSGNPGR